MRNAFPRILLLFAAAFSAEAAQPLSPLPLGLPPIPRDTAFTPERAAYGEFLFRSPALSRDHRIACASCHRADHALADSAPVSTGVFGRKGARNAPALQNLYATENLMWDGRAKLADQPRLPLEAPAEMDVPWDRALRELAFRKETRAYLAVTRRPLSSMDVVLSLAAYVRTLVSGNSRFDRYVYGKEDTALSPAEKRGLALFTGKAGCASCHRIGPESTLFTDGEFHDIGAGRADNPDPGRGGITGDSDDVGAFRTPSLRNVGRTAPYMHDGSLGTLGEVLRFYNRGGGTGKNKDPRVRRLGLTEGELVDLEAFLGALEGEDTVK